MGAFWDQGMVSHHGEGRAGKGPSSALGAALRSPREELLGWEVGLWGWLPGAPRLWSRGEPGRLMGCRSRGLWGASAKPQPGEGFTAVESPPLPRGIPGGEAGEVWGRAVSKGLRARPRLSRGDVHLTMPWLAEGLALTPCGVASQMREVKMSEALITEQSRAFRSDGHLLPFALQDQGDLSTAGCHRGGQGLGQGAPGPANPANISCRGCLQ